MRITRSQALFWRLGRHFLTGDGAGSVEEVVGRLGAVPAISGDPDLAVRRRLRPPAADGVRSALAEGRVLTTYAFRGATHLMTPQDAGTHLALRAAGRMWERASWVDHYRLTPQDWPDLRAVVRDVVASGPVTRAELAAGVAAHPRFRHLREHLVGGNDTLLKPLAWQGDLCFGPDRAGRATFQAPSSVPGWSGIPPLEDAGRAAVRGYLDAYGPATPAHLQYWLGEGLGAGARRITRWLGEVAEDLLEVAVDGEPMLHLRTHLDALREQSPLPVLTLLPGYDQWVLGPGTADERIVPPEHRPVVTRGGSVALIGGAVRGTWTRRGESLTLTWFDAAAAAEGAGHLDAEVARLSTLLGRPLEVATGAA